MTISSLFFISSGLFLGWGLGANHMGNIFGTAVGTKMLSFAKAALICSIFYVIGAVFGGAGAAETLGKLGGINTMPGAFVSAFAAAMAVYLMAKAGLPVSTTQAMIGGILGWNLYTHTAININALKDILIAWIASPLLAALFAVILYKTVKFTLKHYPISLLKMDAYTRFGLILAGIFGAYALGANNISNVMGVFLRNNPFIDSDVMGLTFSGTQKLFLIGGIAIVVGIYTYSKKIIGTVGGGIYKMSPVGAWIVVMAHSIVLFLFSSTTLHAFLQSHHLPTIPLVPVSSSEAVIGAVIGVAMAKGGKGIKWKSLSSVVVGWFSSPIMSCLISFISLFFMENVFNQVVFKG